jgi:hypothetical protein
MDQSDNEEFDPDLRVVVFELSKTSEAAKAKMDRKVLLTWSDVRS